MIRHYSHHLLGVIWRRKSGTLLTVLGLTAVVLMVQYHSASMSLKTEPIPSINVAAESAELQQQHTAQRTLRTLDNGSSDADRSKKLLSGNPAADVPSQARLYETNDITVFQKTPDSNNPSLNSVNSNRDLAGSPKITQPNVVFKRPNFDDNANKIEPRFVQPVTYVPVYQQRDQFVASGRDANNPSLPNSMYNAQKIPHNSPNDPKWTSDVRYNPYLKVNPAKADNSQPAGHVHNYVSNWSPVQYPQYGGLLSQQNRADSQRTAKAANRRIVHLDFKGAPPKVAYLNKVIPLFASLGATGLLIEYEEMFPFTGELAVARAKNHYKEEELASVLKTAAQNNLEVIPLIQTFGHAEFVLKNPEFPLLREVQNVPQSFCPSNNDSMRVVRMIVDQVMSLHQKYVPIRWLHIGCDEVFQLASCPKCMARSIQEGRDTLFLSHVSAVASYVRSKHNVIPIIWDDMLHHFTADSLRKYNMGELVEVMAWTYVDDIYRFIPPDIWAMYGEVFPYVWGASAFKGAFGETLSVPPLKQHLDNNLAWLQVISEQESRFKEFRGLVLTGWQRYDHFSVLCELLPSAIPSLAVNLLSTTHGGYNSTWMKELYDKLQCMKTPKYTTFLDLTNDPHLWDKLGWCFFPGVSFFKVTQRLADVKKSTLDYIQECTVSKGWLTEYNVRHNFSAASRIDELLENYPYQVSDVETLIRQARDALREAFDEYTVAEWIEQNVYPLLRKLELLKMTADTVKKVTHWPKRPLEPLPELVKYGIGIPADDP